MKHLRENTSLKFKGERNGHLMKAADIDVF